MQGVEIAHLNAAIAAALKAFYDFMNSTLEQALTPISHYGKRDTLGMDAGPEIIICQELGKYDAGAVVITEEAGMRAKPFNDSFRPNDPQTFRTVFISDPTDRSNQLKAFLKQFDQNLKVSQIFGNPEYITRWEEKYEKPATITGATSAISCVRRGVPIFAVIVNYITRQLVVSCAAGNRILDLPAERPELIDLALIRRTGTVLTFPDIDSDDGNMQKFVTFLGDVGKVGYAENFKDSNLIDEKDKETYLHYGCPGGPSRILYLSSLQPRDKPVGFVLANGEKIGEWIHWLPFVRFSRCHTDQSQPALITYEIAQDRPHTKEEIMMSTHPNYSVFREFNGKMCVDTSWLLSRFTNPSQARSTLIIAPHDNRWVVRSSSQSGYRSLAF